MFSEKSMFETVYDDLKMEITFLPSCPLPPINRILLIRFLVFNNNNKNYQ
jgi:hypothetical protein